ncbi:MAG: hypothetical protein JKY61_12230 [Planctomycetes bacterium]|nr:hypothetical protein [Planctomycetota bacterium]
MLDEYDKVVSEWEARPNLTLTPDQMNQLAKSSIDFSVKVQEFGEAGGQMTPDEMKRFSDISTRYARVLQKLTP